MKKLILPSLLIAFLLTDVTLSAQNPTAKGRELNEYLKDISNNSGNKLKSLTVSEFPVTNGQPEKSGKLFMEKSYNPDGTVNAEKYYNNKGELNRKITYKYTSFKLPSEKAEFFPNGSVDRKYSFTYDEAGNKLEELKLKPYFQGFSNERRFTYEYDEKGLLLTESGYGSDGSAEWKSEYAYAAGFPKEKSMYTPEGDLVWKDQYTCDTKGNITSTQRTDADGKLISEIDQEYDNAGYLLIQTVKNNEGKIKQKYTSKYNAGHILVEKTVFNAEDNTTTVYKYEYQNY